MAWKETGRTWYARPASSSAQRTRVSRASPLPPSGERSKAVMVMVIEGVLLGEHHRLPWRTSATMVYDDTVARADSSSAAGHTRSLRAPPPFPLPPTPLGP